MLMGSIIPLPPAACHVLLAMYADLLPPHTIVSAAATGPAHGSCSGPPELLTVYVLPQSILLTTAAEAHDI